MKLKFILGDINNSIADYKAKIDMNLSKDEILDSYKKELDKIYENKISVSSFNACNINSYSYDILSIFFDYFIDYNHDIGFINLYFDNEEILEEYKRNYYKIKNEFNRKKDTLANDVDKVYNSNKSVLIFKDTRYQYINDELLINSINDSKSKTKLYDEEFELAEMKENNDLAKVLLTDDRLISASLSYVVKKLKTAILNIGDGIHPGGNVIHGGVTTENSICRISTLYPLLNQPYLFDEYYGHNRSLNNIFSSKVIYIPNVYIFKTDEEYPSLLHKDDWYKINVLTISSPNESENSILDDELYDIVYKRLDQVFKVAVVNNIEVLVLTAFDCGNNLNNPIICAKACKDILEKYKKSFKIIHFAIPLKYIDKYNYDVYKRILGL